MNGNPSSGNALSAILTVVSLVAFLFTVAAAYVANRQGIERLNSDVMQLTRDMVQLRELVARLQEKLERP